MTATMSPITVLTYHQIGEAPPKGSFMRSLHVSPKSFAQQMAWLKRLGYQGLSMQALMPYLRGERVGRVVGITFDDGYRNNLELALPVLQAHGFTATCYVVSGRMGQTNVWDDEHGVIPAPLMSANEVRAWADQGMEVGSHTCTHADLSRSSPDLALAEIRDSRQALEDLLGRAVTQFCYPYGHYQALHANMVREAGYEAATTTQRGRCHGPLDLWQLPRVPVVRSTSWPQFLLKLLTSYEDRHRA
jgi:peptidoglycan/xylan/chitin deacetylase (PgdA/CDA1 family)